MVSSALPSSFSRPPLRLALIDNYDSYTHNLAHLFAQANEHPPTVFRADAFPTLAALHAAHGHFDAYILSPGPGTPHNPADFPALERDILAARLPTLGVCLGHQALCAAYGARVERAPAGPVHGVVARVVRAPAGHDCPVLRGLPSVFDAVRYHSLAVCTEGLCQALLPTAWAVDVTPDGRQHRVLMSVRHRDAPLFGVQFHPESVGSEGGLRIADNFLQVARAFATCGYVPRARPREQRSGQGKSGAGAGLRTMVRSLRDVSADSASLFVSLFGEEPVSFWLDSSSAIKTASSLSRCSSPDLASSADTPREAVLREESLAHAGTSGSRTGRFSIMGACDGPLSELVTYDVQAGCVTASDSRGQIKGQQKGTIFDYLESSLRSRYAPCHPDLPMEMNGGYVGFFGYELKADTDSVKKNKHRSGVPDAWFVFADRVVLVDHEDDSLFMIAVVRENCTQDEAQADRWFSDTLRRLGQFKRLSAGNGITEALRGPAPYLAGDQRPPLKFIPESYRASYLSDIRSCLKEIEDGESYEVCLTNRLQTILPGDFDPLQIYCALRLLNPAPYAAFLRLNDDVAVCCSSPERYLQISSSGHVESKPIKGTVHRGRTLEEDEFLRLKLQNSPKDRSENLMIVDLVRNDLSRTCRAGSVRVPKLMHVESYATVHQLVSTVTGFLTPSEDAVRCIRAAYPMGSMTGAPKVRTMEIIERLEKSARGIYSGSIGYLSLCGAADLNVVIRTAVINGRMVEIGVGGAIVALSTPEEEYDEVILKGKAIMQSLALKTTGRSDFVIVHEPNTVEHINRGGGT